MASTDSVVAAPQRRRSAQALQLARDYGIVVAFGLVFLILAVTTPNFATSENLENVLYQNAPLAIIACGITIAMITGGFDLSVGWTFALAGVTSAWLANHLDTTAGMVLTLLLGVGVGIFNGLLITVLRINSFLATLASSLLVFGIAQKISGGFLIYVDDRGYQVPGAGEFLTVKNASWILGGVALFFGIILARSTFGRYAYAVGGNPQAARLSGVRVAHVRIAAFAISGFCAALAGILYASRTGNGSINVGAELLPLTAIAGVVVGGTNIMGGAGAMWRSVLGLFFLALITNAFNIAGYEPYWQNILTGGIIIVAVAMNAFSRTSR